MIVLAPVYQPGDRLVTVLRDLRDAAPDVDVVVIDDGSDGRSAAVLDAAAGLGCAVLRHDTNRGKGVALKTGFAHIATTHPGHDVVSADPDGQHQVADVLKVADRLRGTDRIVLGVRRFDGEVPLRSKVGNHLTRLLFRAATGRAVQDTQTGLRGYPADLIGWLRSIPGERFEYEMNVLLYAAREGHRIDEVTIATTYHKDGRSSHFSEVSDSARIYWPLLRFAATSLVGRRRSAP